MKDVADWQARILSVVSFVLTLFIRVDAVFFNSFPSQRSGMGSAVTPDGTIFAFGGHLPSGKEMSATWDEAWNLREPCMRGTSALRGQIAYLRTRG